MLKNLTLTFIKYFLAKTLVVDIDTQSFKTLLHLNKSLSSLGAIIYTKNIVNDFNNEK